MAFAWVHIANLKGATGDKGDSGDALNASDAATLINDRDILTGPDIRTPRLTSGEWKIPFTDDEGYVAGGFTHGGQLEVFKAPIFPTSSIDIAALDAGSGAGALDPTTGYIWGAFDPAGYMSAGIRRDGGLYIPVSGPVNTSSRRRVTLFGDSLIRGYTQSVAWPLEDSLPSKLAAIRPDLTVTNKGFGGNATDEVRMRVGAISIWASPVGGIIPATGPVAVTVQQKFGSVTARDNDYWGSWAGVVGTLTRTMAGVWSFLRDASGTPVPVPAPAPFSRVDETSWDTSVIWMGRNDVSYGVTGGDIDVVEHVVSSIRDLTEWLSPRRRQFLVVSVVNRQDEPQGSAKYKQILEVNERLAELFPGRFMDIRSWMVNQAIHDAMLTPTAADLQAMAADCPPPQITDGGSHYTKTITPLLAAKFNKFFTEKGFI